MSDLESSPPSPKPLQPKDDRTSLLRFRLHPRNPPIQAAVSSSSSSPSSPTASSGIDLSALESAINKKDSNGVKEALDKLSGEGWAKKWSSQPYLSRHTTSLRELTTLGIKNAETLAIPSVRNDFDVSEFAQVEANRSSHVDFTYSTDMPSNLGNMMGIRNRVRDRTMHQQLKDDLVEHIWNKFGTNQD